ncbi:hypothetical protein EVC45_30260 [Paraburkholderia sp. UYCP14C]|uniref:hypothetical protein n=1 Tax=Paraburkholderia sp. UYCP14C TaxID=2511130 RepID=UPI00101F28E7|nr:hypothetical protein [Paraburkholderia sp. UYCP14C]RZF25981.1 hypothetical protein EVC45_30260 [Paraburkholderia sp. UYCP14C]
MDGEEAALLMPRYSADATVVALRCGSNACMNEGEQAGEVALAFTLDGIPDIIKRSLENVILYR